MQTNPSTVGEQAGADTQRKSSGDVGIVDIVLALAASMRFWKSVLQDDLIFAANTARGDRGDDGDLGVLGSGKTQQALQIRDSNFGTKIT